MSEDAGGQDDFVHLDRIGTAGTASAEDTLRAFVAGVSDAACARLERAAGLEVATDPAELASVDLVVVSTRLPRGQLGPLLATVLETGAGPLVALAHTGGEQLAVEIMRAGGRGVVAEGNEAAIRALVGDANHDQSLVETYDRQVAQTATVDPMRGRDRDTGLPGAGAFDQHVADLVSAGDVPRVALLRVVGLEERGNRLSAEGTTLLRRRLSMSLRQLARDGNASLYSVDRTEFGLVAPDLSPNRMEQLARQMARVTETYTPMGNRVLALAVGHAGPESASDGTPLGDIARRALEVACADKHSSVVSAEKLGLGVSSTTELEAVLQAVAAVERHAPYGAGHGRRVAEWAGEIAWQLGIEGQARTRVQLAGLVADAGCVSLSKEHLAHVDTLTGEVREAYRSHPVRGERWLRPSAGEDVAATVRAHHEHWDGSGYPDGIAGERIPLPARIVRLADTLDRLLAGSDPAFDHPLPPAEALEELEARAGAELDPTVVEAALPVLDKLLSARDG